VVLALREVVRLDLRVAADPRAEVAREERLVQQEQQSPLVSVLSVTQGNTFDKILHVSGAVTRN
jgi:hypothetical protein